MKQAFGAVTAESKVRLHDGKVCGRNVTTTTTFTLGLQVEAPITSLEEALNQNFEPSIREARSRPPRWAGVGGGGGVVFGVPRVGGWGFGAGGFSSCRQTPSPPPPHRQITS